MAAQIRLTPENPANAVKSLRQLFPEEFIGQSVRGGAWTFLFVDGFSDIDRARSVILGEEVVVLPIEFEIPEDVNAPDVPKIYALAREEAKEKHFHNINYNTELAQPLYRTDTFGEPGLLTKVEWYSDLAKTDLVLVVDRVYTVQQGIGLVAKSTTRTWINNDNTPHELIKDLGTVPYTPSASRSATKRRRQNVIDSLEQDVIGLLAQSGGDFAQGIELAQRFLAELAAPIDVFYKSGYTVDLINLISQPEVQEMYPFLVAEVQPGVTVAQFIASSLTY